MVTYCNSSMRTEGLFPTKIKAKFFCAKGVELSVIVTAHEAILCPPGRTMMQACLKREP